MNGEVFNSTLGFIGTGEGLRCRKQVLLWLGGCLWSQAS